MILLLILFPFFLFFWFFCFNDTATTEIYTLSLHDALPIWWQRSLRDGRFVAGDDEVADSAVMRVRSEEHTSELQSRSDIGCRLLLENNKSFHLAPAEGMASGRVPALLGWPGAG